MKLPEDFFHWQVIFSVRPPQQTVTMFVGKLVRSVVKTEKIGSAIARSLLAVAFIATLASASAAAQPREQQFNIPKQAVDQALDALATQANVFLLFPYDQVLAVDANPVKGKYSIAQALDILLKNTGLSGDLTQGGVITISPNDLNQNGKGKRMNINKRKNLLATFIAVFAAGATNQGAMAQDGEAATAQSGIDEIVVTATRRATSLQDTAMSITAISSEAIDKKGLIGMNDYLRTLPGVNMVEQGAGRKNPIIIRGIAVDPQGEDGSVGVYLGEVPLTASSIGGGFDFGAPDIKLVDIERIEVLRGPQGTLYGSGSLGGTIRVIPTEPDLGEVQGEIFTGFSNTAKNGSDNYVVKGILNLPLAEDVLAVRAVLYRYDNSGYINNIAGSNDGPVPTTARSLGAQTIDVDDIGHDTYTGGRVTLKWQPSDSFDAKLSYMQQETTQDGLPDVEIGLGAYEQARAQTTLDIGAGLESEVSVTNLELQYDFGWAELLSSSSLMKNKPVYARDLTFLGFTADQQTSADIETFVEEIRLTSSLDGRFQYIAGLYYEDVDWVTGAFFNWSGDPAQNFFLVDAVLLGGFDFTHTLEQKAVFGEVSYEVRDDLTVTLGARIFSYDRAQAVRDRNSPVFANADTNLANSESGQTYKANLSYTPSENALLYAQWAEGFRLGSPLPPLDPVFCDLNDEGKFVAANGQLVGQGDKLDSDTTENFEVGGKFSLLDNRMTLNAAVYNINWDNIPVSVIAANGTCTAFQNAGTAQSQGAEIEVNFQVTESLRVDTGFSYTDAKLTADAGGIGNDGDRLPGTPKFNANLSLQYDFDLGGKPVFVRGDYAYVGGYYNNLQKIGTETGDYHQVNMKAGINLGSVDFDIAINNLTNADDLTWANSVITQDARAYRLRPRTIGFNVHYQF